MDKNAKLINIIKELSEFPDEDIAIVEEVVKSCNILQSVKNNKIQNIQLVTNKIKAN